MDCIGVVEFCAVTITGLDNASTWMENLLHSATFKRIYIIQENHDCLTNISNLMG